MTMLISTLLSHNKVVTLEVTASQVMHAITVCCYETDKTNFQPLIYIMGMSVCSADAFG